MKQLKTYVVVILLLTILIIPSVALAAWWNPFTWNIWNNFLNIFSKQNTSTQNNSDKSNYLSLEGKYKSYNTDSLKIIADNMSEDNILNKAIKDKDPSDCNELAAKEELSIRTYAESIKVSTSSVESEKSILYPYVNNCKFGYALHYNDTSVCELIWNSRGSECYTQIAKQTKNPALCFYNRDNNYLKNLYNKFTEDGKGSLSSIDSCVFDIANSENNISICDTLKNMRDISPYFNDVGCYYGYGYKRKNMNDCNNIANHEAILKDYCTYGVAVASLDPSICPKLGNETISPNGLGARDGCFDAMGEHFWDVNYCDKIQSDVEQQLCYYVVAENNFPSAGNKLKDPEKEKAAESYYNYIHSNKKMDTCNMYNEDLTNLVPIWQETFETGSQWSGKNSQVIMQNPNNAAVRITGAPKSDGYLYKTITIPTDAYYMTYYIKNEKAVKQSFVTVSFGNELLSYRILGEVCDKMETSEQIYIGDKAGKTDVLTFELAQVGNEEPSVLIYNITFYKIK